MPNETSSDTPIPASPELGISKGLPVGVHWDLKNGIHQKRSSHGTGPIFFC